jgi:site-specific recombinase XerD
VFEARDKHGRVKWKNDNNDREKIFEALVLEINDARLPSLLKWVTAWEEYLLTIVGPHDPTGRLAYIIAVRARGVIRVLIRGHMNVTPQNFDYTCLVEVKMSLQQRLQPNSVRTIIKGIRTLLKFLVERGDLKHNVIESGMIPRTMAIDRARVAPDDAFEVAMAALPGPRQQLLTAVGLLLLANTGLRIAEFWNLRASALVTQHETLGPHLIVMGKGDCERVVPLTKPFARILQEYIRVFCPRPESDFMFHRAGGGDQPISIGFFQRIIIRAERKMGRVGPVCNSRNMRRGLARVLHNRGMRLDHIQKLYGHSKISDTKEYVGKDETRIYEELNAAHPSFQGEAGVRRRAKRSQRTTFEKPALNTRFRQDPRV